MVRIIIIEDMPIVREGICRLIEQITDFEIIKEYTSGSNFLKDIHLYTDEVILMDIELPDLNGIQTTKKALAVKPNLKVIALTMFNIHSYYFEMFEAGAKGFILKQSSVSELENAIREVNNNKIYFAKEVMFSILSRINHNTLKNADFKEQYYDLNKRDIDLLSYMCQGYTNKELADVLFISVKTVEAIKTKLLQKTNTRNSIELVIWALKNKIIPIEKLTV